MCKCKDCKKIFTHDAKLKQHIHVIHNENNEKSGEYEKDKDSVFESSHSMQNEVLEDLEY